MSSPIFVIKSLDEKCECCGSDGILVDDHQAFLEFNSRREAEIHIMHNEARMTVGVLDETSHH